MKKATYILIAISIIILSGCYIPFDSDTNNFNVKKSYPRFLKQKENIKDIIVVSDYSIYELDISHSKNIDSSLVKKLSDSVNKSISKMLAVKGYIVSKVYQPTVMAFNEEIPIIKKIDTSNKDIDMNRSSGRIGKKNIVYYPPTINKLFFSSNFYQNRKVYDEVLPNKFEPKSKVLFLGDTINQENINVAVLILIRRISESTGRSVVKGLRPSMGAGGGFGLSINIPLNSNDLTEVHIYIIDRKTNDVIWHNIEYSNDIESNDINGLINLIGTIIKELPAKGIKSDNIFD